ncbi:MAG TPA: hypothetical protein VIV60_03605 [Polyangiaceae bacterium]
MTRRRLSLQVALVLSLALIAVVWRWLSLVSLFVCLVTLLTYPRGSGVKGSRWAWPILWVAASATLVGLTRFVYLDAVPGIVQGGEQAVQQRAVSHLREILRVEDAMRQAGVNDADGDGIGSAPLIGELAGVIPARKGVLGQIPLNKRFQATVDTPIGPAAVIDGYAFAVCLRTLVGNYSAKPGERFDEEASERMFVALAWPLDSSRSAFAIDADDRILMRMNHVPGRPNYAGQMHPPDCGTVADAASNDGWVPWRGKQPRPQAKALIHQTAAK